MRLRCGSLSITTPESLLANEFNIGSVLHGQVSLAAVIQICVIHEAINGFKNLGLLKVWFENVNILQYLFVNKRGECFYERQYLYKTLK